MLKIHKDVQSELVHAFLSVNQEQGFVLGCTTRLDELNHCCQIPAVQAGKYFYIPDSEKANSIIHDWAKQDICFCGFIHSHLVDRSTLSEDDEHFARQLFTAYSLPILWFGIGVVIDHKVKFFFNSVTEINGEKVLRPVEFEVGR